MLQTKVFFQLYKCVTLTSPEAYIGAQWVLLSVKSNRVIMSQTCRVSTIFRDGIIGTL